MSTPELDRETLDWLHAHEDDIHSAAKGDEYEPDTLTFPRPMSVAQLLEEANASLARAEGLLGRAADELGPPVQEPLQLLAEDLAHLRRRIRTATTVATAHTTRAEPR